MHTDAQIQRIFQDLDTRDKIYRFEIQRDIPWTKSLREGRFFNEKLYQLFGFNREVLLHETIRQELEWCWALSICYSFIYFERDIIRKLGDVANEIAHTGSSKILIEEEVKHIKLFKKLAAALEAARPEWVDDFKRVYKDPVVYEVPFSSRTDLTRLEQHQFLIWLYTLFFEDYTIYLHEMMIEDQNDLHPTWYHAHRCHRQEEEEHVRTDAAYLELCNLTQEEKRRLGKEFFLSVHQNYKDFFCLSACDAFIQRRHPRFSGRGF